jgi:hypothetical protein
MKINQDTPFAKDTIVGSGGILYALANKTTSTDEEGKVSYVADLVKIENISDTKKAIKKFKIENLTVTTTAGNVFDADDSGRASMNEAIAAAAILGLTENNWKMADNTIKLIQLADLKEALALGIQAKGNIILS